MSFRALRSALLLSLLLPAASQAQARLPERAVRRDIPMTNAIRRSFASGARDSTGRPTTRYWQLVTDYTIQVRLDPGTQRLTGRETIALKNNSPDSLTQIVLRLDPNIFLGNVPRASPWIPALCISGRCRNSRPPPRSCSGSLATSLSAWASGIPTKSSSGSGASSSHCLHF